jgi:hypothetical protein
MERNSLFGAVSQSYEVTNRGDRLAQSEGSDANEGAVTGALVLRLGIRNLLLAPN